MQGSLGCEAPSVTNLRRQAAGGAVGDDLHALGQAAEGACLTTQRWVWDRL